MNMFNNTEAAIPPQKKQTIPPYNFPLSQTNW